MKTVTIAVLMTCHNRQAKTLASLEALFKQELPKEVELQVYLLDDASTDGTAEAVNAKYSQVKILHGNGNLFWNGGMRQAFAEAIKSDYDYYLWLNDDTQLYPQALNILLTTSRSLAEKGEQRAIITGSTCDANTGNLTYGGMARSSWWHPLHFSPVKPGETAKPCDTMHGNCVLIPRSVAQLVGNLHPGYVHTMGDWDYGLRSQRKGSTVWVAPGYIGTCQRNLRQGLVLHDTELTLAQRVKKAGQPKGLPLQEWKVFVQQHAGFLWPIYWLLPYVRMVLISITGKGLGYRG